MDEASIFLMMMNFLREKVVGEEEEGGFDFGGKQNRFGNCYKRALFDRKLLNAPFWD